METHSSRALNVEFLDACELGLPGVASKALRDTKRGENAIDRPDGLFRQLDPYL